MLSPGIRIIWGVSANSRTTALLEEGQASDYIPLNDAETLAIQVTSDKGDEPDVRWLVGGACTTTTLE